jgi:hypothetical protein
MVEHVYPRMAKINEKGSKEGLNKSAQQIIPARMEMSPDNLKRFMTITRYWFVP